MKYIGWCLAFISMSIAILTAALNHNQKYEIEYQKKINAALRAKNKELEEKQKQIDWMKSELEAIDNYIAAVDCLRIKGVETIPKGLEKRTKEELNAARYEVIQKAIAMDREYKTKGGKEK